MQRERRVARLLHAALVTFAASLVAAGCASRSSGAPTHFVPVMPPVQDAKIVPGQRVGPVSLGMSPADLLGALGDPDHVGSDGDFPGAKLYFFNARGLQVTVDGSQVVQIAVNGTQFATQEGIAVGSTELRATALLGSPSITKRYQRECAGRVSGYHYPGLWIHFTCDGHVAEIRVWGGT